MSLILDALNRADQERSAQQAVPTIQTVQRLHSPPRGWPVWERLAVLLIVGCAVLYGVLEKVLPQVAPETVAPVDALAVTSTPVLPAQSRVSAQPPAEFPGPPSVSARSGREASPERGSMKAPSAAVTPAKKSVEPEEISRLYAVPISTPPVTEELGDSTVAGSSLEEQIALAVRPEASPAPEATTVDGLVSVPYITDLPLQLRRDIPSLNYSEHLPASDGRPGQVRLNGRLLGEGQQVASDLELVSIREWGILMQFRGVSFRLPALNRWVNF